jgi:hypothetical protein
MYGRATNLAKKAVSEMNKHKLKELVKTSLMNEADIETMADRIGGEETLSQASMMLDDLEQKLLLVYLKFALDTHMKVRVC